MEEEKYKKTRVYSTPINRFRILTNQRTQFLRKENIITPEFVAEMASSAEKQSKTTSRTLMIAFLYLAILYTAYTGNGVKIAILGVDFSNVPRLLEISIALFSISIFSLGIQILNAEVLRQSINSTVGSLLPDDEIFQSLIMYRSIALSGFLFPFRKTLRIGEESIRPVGITNFINSIFFIITIANMLVIYCLPVVFLLGYAVPSMNTSIFSIGIGLLAWVTSLFLLGSIAAFFIKLPYDEYLLEN